MRTCRALAMLLLVFAAVAVGREPVVTSGTVTDTAGRPLADVQVTSLNAAGRAGPSTVTDEAGAFRLAAAGRTRLRFTGRSFLTNEIAVPDATTGLRIRLIRACSLTVRVRDTEGAPVPKLRAELVSAEDVSRGALGRPLEPDREPITVAEGTDDGTVRFDALRPGLYTVRLDAPGFRPEDVEKIALSEGEAGSRLVELRSVIRLSGRVLDTDDRPIRGARVGILAYPSGEDKRAYWGFTVVGWVGTDRKGRYSLVLGEGDHRREQTLKIVATASGRSTRILLLNAEQTETDITQDFVLPAGAVVAGTVQDEYGNPIAHQRMLGELVIRYRDPDTGRRVSVPGVDLFSLLSLNGANKGFRTDGDGRFRIDSLPGGPISLGLYLPAHPTMPLHTGELEEGETVEGLQLVLKSGRSLQGRVLSLDGDPIEGARIESDARRHYTTSGPDGAFSLSGFEQDTVPLLSVNAPGFGRRLYQNLEISDHPLVVHLPLAGRLSGSVSDAAVGSPVSAFAVRMIPEALGEEVLGETREQVFSSPAGLLSMEDVTPGVYRIDVFAEGYLPTSMEEVTITGGQDTPLAAVRLERGLAVKGVVQSGDSLPVAGTQISVSSLRRGERLTRLPGMLTSGRFYSDEQGRFEVGGITLTDVRLSIRHPDYAPELQSLSFEDGVTRKEIQVPLTASSTLEVTVVDAEGRPVPDVPVAIQNAELHRRRIGPRASTDAEGKAVFRRLPPGPYTILHMEKALREELDLTAGATGRVTLHDVGAMLRGALAYRGEPLPAGTVTLYSDEIRQMQPGYTFLTAPVEAGAFRIGPVPPGNYSLRARAGWPPEAARSEQAILQSTLTIEIGEDIDELQVDMEIPDLRYEGRVVQAGTDEGVPGVYVFLTGESANMAGATTGDDGDFRIHLERAGRYQVRARKDVSGRRGLMLSEPTDVDLTRNGIVTGQRLEVVTGPAVSGTVTGPDGRPLAGVAVRYLSLNELPPDASLPIAPSTASAGSETPAKSAAAVTDASGAFLLEGQEAGVGLVYASSPEYAPAWVPVTLGFEDVPKADFRLENGGTLVLELPSGWSDSDDLQMVLWDPELPLPIRFADRQSMADSARVGFPSSDRVVIEHLPVRSWTVEVTTGDQTRRSPVTLSEGETQTLDLTSSAARVGDGPGSG